MHLAARGFGMLLMVFGLVVALTVIVSAWSLYHDPSNIDGFARAVERGSHIDKAVRGAASDARRQLDLGVRPDAARLPGDSPAPGAAPQDVSVAYFVAWLLAILLLFLLGTLAMAAVRTGGELVLYDAKVKKLARAIIDEITRGQN